MRSRLPALLLYAIIPACALAACSDSPSDRPEDSGVSDGAADLADSDLTETGSPDADDAAAGAADVLDPPSYLERCESLFAARILELQLQERPEFPADCTSALADEIPLANGAVACQAGESANACRQRLYDTPPSAAELRPGCWDETNPEGCLRAKWLPRCVDGTDACATDEVVCVDGSRPMVWAEGATRAPSDDWLIFMGGEGDPCTGVNCWIDYRYGHLNNFATPRAITTLHPDHTTAASQTGQGIMNGTDVAANPFAAYNRVHFDRCGDAASDAVEQVPVADGLPPRLADLIPQVPVWTRMSTVPVYNRGLDTWIGLFHSLTTTTGRDLDGDDTPDLPDLGEARTVVLVGGSDASVWLIYAADELARELRAIAGDDVDVRLVIDGFFEPGLDNEGRYHPDAPEDFDLFRHPYGVTGLCELPEGQDPTSARTCSDAGFALGGSGGNFHRADLDTRNVVRDVSCALEHGEDSAACADKLHTLFQHVEVPFLVLADQEDRTVSGLPPVFADDQGYRWTLSEYRTRVLDQATDLALHWSTSAREDGPGTAGMAALILLKARRDGASPNLATHVRIGDDERMSARMTRCDAELEELASPTLAALVNAWISGPVPSAFVVENRAAWDGSSPFWVTGARCREPQ